jgi:hypothetical protein
MIVKSRIVERSDRVVEDKEEREADGGTSN